MYQTSSSIDPPLLVMRSYDTQERMQWIKSAQIESVVTGPSKGLWEMLLLPMSRATLVITTEGADNVQFSQIAPDHCAFVFSMSGKAIVNSQEVAQDQFLLLGPDAESCGRVTADLQWAGFALSLEALERYFRLLEAPLPRSASGGRAIFAPPMKIVDRLQQLLQAACQAGSSASLLSTPACRIALEEAFVGTIARVVGQPLAPYRRSVAHGRVFSRAVEYIRAHNEAVGISDLCEALGVSARTLFYAFNELTGLSPLKYVRLRRLHLVRSHLLSHPSSTVTDAATRFGFFELGRFAAQYRAAFGETPGETRRLNAP